MSYLMIDMGGTNIRFAMQGQTKPVTYQCKDFQKIEDAFDAFKKEMELGKWPARAIMGVPGPVHDGTLKFDNNPWRFTKDELMEKFKFKTLKIYNDFQAAAFAVPFLKEKDVFKMNDVEPDPMAPIGVIGAGTGLGEALVVPFKHSWKVVGAEGGHSTLCCVTEVEIKLYQYAMKKFGHVSSERFVSGQGLVETFNGLRVLNGKNEVEITPSEITKAAVGGDAESLTAVNQMFAFWGNMAGNVALIAGTFGGIYLTGGIIRQDGVLELFKKSPFIERFYEKGRRRIGFMDRIPVRVVTAHDTAFIGLEHLLEEGL